ncbi:MAG: glycerol kinase GlpK [Clostridiales bacterium]|jgi:glycerol kinase|nr:glycerol kinase GlpK [Clostridiales bacterium]
MGEKRSYVLAIDQGTTSTRSIIFDDTGKPVSQAGLGHRQIYENGTWVSHDASEILDNVIKTANEAIKAANISPSEIAALGITNQRETVVAWDAQSAKPICGAIVWQCKRTAQRCREILEDSFAKEIRNRTGLCIDPYFSASKIEWILNNVPQAKELLKKGALRIGTVDSFLIYNLTGNFATDYTNASRTMLFNIHTLKWDNDLLNYFGVNRSILPDVKSTSGFLGEADAKFFGAKIPVMAAAGDQSAALFGQTCFTPGDVKNTYGTGCFILKNIGEKPIIPKKDLLATIGWNMGGKTVYALEGSVFTAGAVIEWLINNLKLISGVEEFNEILNSTSSTGGVYFVPALAGLGAPFWDMYANAEITGLNLSSGKNEIVRAAAESIAYRTRDVLDYMEMETNIKPKILNVDGGVSKSSFLMQFQADILNINVEKPAVTETTAIGAAFLAGIAAGVYANMDVIKKCRETDKIFTPNMDETEREEKYARWKAALNKAMSK